MTTNYETPAAALKACTGATRVTYTVEQVNPDGTITTLSVEVAE